MGNGGAGDDLINGGTGRDILNGDTGFDILNGGSDMDILNSGPGGGIFNGDSGSDIIRTGAGFTSRFAPLLTRGNVNPVFIDVFEATGGTGQDIFQPIAQSNVEGRRYDGLNLTLIRDFGPNEVLELPGSPDDYRARFVGGNTHIQYVENGIASDAASLGPISIGSIQREVVLKEFDIVVLEGYRLGTSMLGAEAQGLFRFAR